MAESKLCSERCRKTTAEAKYYNFDFSADMESGETILTAVAAVTPTTGAPTCGSPHTDGQSVQVKISAGSEGAYLVGMTITTSAGETLQGFGYIDITAN